MKLTSSISWFCSAVPQRHTRYSCLKDPFTWKAEDWQQVFASSAAFSSFFSFISCFTLIPNSTIPSCARNSSTETFNMHFFKIHVKYLNFFFFFFLMEVLNNFLSSKILNTVLLLPRLHKIYFKPFSLIVLEDVQHRDQPDPLLWLIGPAATVRNLKVICNQEMSFTCHIKQNRLHTFIWAILSKFGASCRNDAEEVVLLPGSTNAQEVDNKFQTALPSACTLCMERFRAQDGR